MVDGEEPIKALEKTSTLFNIDGSSLHLLRKDKILQNFFDMHDPTTLNKQGADIGSQYRSAIFYHNKSQKNIAENLKAELDKTNIFDSNMVTEIVASATFYIAEESHQDYFKRNPDIPYCMYVIEPKLTKFLSNYSRGS